MEDGSRVVITTFISWNTKYVCIVENFFDVPFTVFSPL